MDVKEAVAAAKGGQVQFKVGKGGRYPCGRRQSLLHGRGFGTKHPRLCRGGCEGETSGAKGTYLRKIAVSSTMGPGVSVAVDSATGA